MTGCIDPSAFALPALYTYGNAGRNILRGPGLVNLDFSLFKNIPLGEKVKLQFRAEAFNVSNTPSFGNPNSTITFSSAGVYTPSSFGNITSTANNNRQIQFGAKILF